MSSPVSDFFFLLDALGGIFYFYALGGIFSQKLNKLRQEGMTSEFRTSHTQGAICSDLLSNFPLHCLGYIRNIPVCCKKSSSLPLGEWKERSCGNMRQCGMPPQTTSKDPGIQR